MNSYITNWAVDNDGDVAAKTNFKIKQIIYNIDNSLNKIGLNTCIDVAYLVTWIILIIYN